MILRIGYKSLNRDAAPHVIYCGLDGNEAVAAVAKVKPGDFARICKVEYPMMIPVATPTAPDQSEKFDNKKRK